MLRLFVGIALPPEHRLQLSVLASGLRGAKWVDPGNYHVTLRFIGEVDEAVAADIDAALETVRCPPFDLAIAGIGLFGSGDRPRQVHANVERSVGLERLQHQVSQRLDRLFLPADHRRYVPHVTLARFPGGMLSADELKRYVEANALLRLAPFRVERFALIVSYLTRSGSIYEDAAEYRLR